MPLPVREGPICVACNGRPERAQKRPGRHATILQRDSPSKLPIFKIMTAMSSRDAFVLTVLAVLNPGAGHRTLGREISTTVLKSPRGSALGKLPGCSCCSFVSGRSKSPRELRKLVSITLRFRRPSQRLIEQSQSHADGGVLRLARPACGGKFPCTSRSGGSDARQDMLLQSAKICPLT
jgi:hypothetical protein